MRGLRPPTSDLRSPRPLFGRPEWFLARFDPLFAPNIAGWVRTEQELTWLAPGTVPPLTPQKVVTWGKDRDRRFLFYGGRRDTPIGYAELNRMPGRPQAMWIGHFVVDPAQRGRSHGSRFARALLALAFGQYAATDVLLVVLPDNTAAIRCYERAGMAVVNRERKYFENTGREHVFLRMTINRARYHQLVAVGQLAARPPRVHADPAAGPAPG